MFCYLRNLSSTSMSEGVAPWEWTGRNLVPQECFKDKVARDVWINHPETDYYVYSPWEGSNPRERIHKSNSDRDDNPPVRLNYVALDCDVEMGLPDVNRWSAATENPPAWFEQTLSGHGRVCWLLERPLIIPSRGFAEFLMTTIADLVPLSIWPGLDVGALHDPARYYTNGGLWYPVSKNIIPHTRAVGWMVSAGEKFNWTAREFGPATSLEKIEAECVKRFPGFRAAWPGEFVVGAQGPSFWVPGSASPKSAIVKEAGMWTFSDHAVKGFYPWAEIVGAQFVNNTQNELIGGAVEGVYFDGQKFLVQDTSGKWQPKSTELIRLELIVGRGLSPKSKGGPSDVDRALHHVTQSKNIFGAASFAFYPKGVIQYQGQAILNTHDRDVLPPASESSPFGPDGKFPVLSEYLTHFFTSPDQLQIFLARVARGYIACRNRSPVQSQAVVLCGPADRGKTFMTRAILGGLMNGFAEATAYFTGSDSFNSEMFDVAVWTMDDGAGLTSEFVHRVVSEKLKQSVANPDHRSNEKFRKAVTVPWSHFVVMTCNDDPESVRSIPNLDQNSLDKLLVFRVADQTPFKFRPLGEMKQIVADELPHLARWLLDFTPGEEVTAGASPRWGIRSYCEPSLLKITNQSTPTSAFGELLVKFLREYFAANESATCWQGTATDLRIDMCSNFAFTELLRGYKQENFPRLLAQLQGKRMLKIDIVEDSDERIWRITRDDRFHRKAMAFVEQSTSGKFVKS